MRGSAEEKWKTLLADHAESGLTVVEFCRRRRVSKQSFYSWRRRFARQETSTQPTRHQSAPVAFAPVAVLQTCSASSITIHLPDDVRIEVAGVVDRRTLAEVLSALRDSERSEASC